jgi:hypothetical protein
MIKIVIPTCKSEEEVKSQLTEIKQNTPDDVDIIISSTTGSAAYNRNICLSKTKLGDCIIMLDDDIVGFFPHWHRLLLLPFITLQDTLMISARLMKANDKPAYMMGENYNLEDEFIEMSVRRLPTACIAFINDGITFDESFTGSGFEDDDFCMQKSIRHPDKSFIINNAVKLTHLNEMKNQKGDNWEHNRRYYLTKWPQEENRWK